MFSLVVTLTLLQSVAGAADSARQVVDRLAAMLPAPSDVRTALDSLAREARAARAASEAAGAKLTDTLVNGPVTLLTTRVERQAFAGVLSEASRAWSGLFAGPAPEVWLEVRGGAWSPARTLVGRYRADTVFRAATHLGVRLRGPDPESFARRAAGDVLGQLLLDRADPSLRDWLVVGPTPIGQPAGTDELSYQLATSVAPATTACRDGDRSRCPAAFGLDGGITKELSLAARGALVREALDVGGPGAWERLLAQPDRSLSDRLAAAAGRPPEVLIDRLMARARADRSGGPGADPLRWWVAAGWLALALGMVVGGGIRR
ncbi:MAG: hypothetical protein JNJ80_20210 [Gemmatimonadetes bacterium]|nr:hypothetical protein [Gemmatimonadota bacterium]